MDDNSLFKKVYKHPLITQNLLQKIKEKHFFKDFKKGDCLIRINEASNHYFILKSGMARAQVFDFKGNDITTQFFVSGSIVIAPLALFKQTLPLDNVFVLTEFEVWTIHFKYFHFLFVIKIVLVD